MGTLKVEVSGSTHAELRKQLQEVIWELNRINFTPGMRLNLGTRQSWKCFETPQGRMVLGGPQTWKCAGVENPATKVNLNSQQFWKVTYET
jgi:hypothetical protein